MNKESQKYEYWWNNKTILIAFIITTGCLIGLIGSIIYYSDIEPKQTKAKIQEKVNEMLLTNKTYQCFNCGNYVEGVGMLSFSYYDGRMHHGSMTFQDPYGQILCCNSLRNYQYFKAIMGDPLDES